MSGLADIYALRICFWVIISKSIKVKIVDARLLNGEAADYYSFDEEVPVGIFDGVTVVLNDIL